MLVLSNGRRHVWQLPPIESRHTLQTTCPQGIATKPCVPKQTAHSRDAVLGLAGLAGFFEWKNSHPFLTQLFLVQGCVYIEPLRARAGSRTPPSPWRKAHVPLRL